MHSQSVSLDIIGKLDDYSKDKYKLIAEAMVEQDPVIREKLIVSGTIFFPYLDKFINNLNKKISSPECALLLREAYYEKFFNNLEHNLEYTYSSILYRKEEYLGDDELLSRYMDKYINLDIKRVFGITIIEYMNLTPREFDILNKKAEAYAKAQSEELRKIHSADDNKGKQKDINSVSKQMVKNPKAAGKALGGNAVAAFEDLVGGEL